MAKTRDYYYDLITNQIGKPHFKVPLPGYLGRGLAFEPSRKIVVAGDTGSGKSAFLDWSLYKAERWLNSSKNTPFKSLGSLKMKVLYFSMERTKKDWYSKRTAFIHASLPNDKKGEFKDTTFSVDSLNFLLSEPKSDLHRVKQKKLIPFIEKCQKYFDKIEKNPKSNFQLLHFPGRYTVKFIKNEIDKIVRQGHFDKTDQIFKINGDPYIILLVIDTVGKYKGFSKETLDQASDMISDYRDKMGLTSIEVSQFNRAIYDKERVSRPDFSPQLNDIKNTSDLAEDSDSVIALFHPARYNKNTECGYTVSKMVNSKGDPLLRSAYLLKSSFGPADIRVPFLFAGAYGNFIEIPSITKNDPNSDTKFEKVMAKIKQLSLENENEKRLITEIQNYKH